MNLMLSIHGAFLLAAAAAVPQVSLEGLAWMAATGR
jgi:hypothetical protein